MRLFLITAIILAGCASSEHKAWKAQCLPNTGCPSELETPEQFSARKIIDKKCEENGGCDGVPEYDAMIEARKAKWASEAKAEADKKSKKEANDKLYRECAFEADKALAGRSRPYSNFDIIYNTIMDDMSRSNLIASCIRARS